MSIRTLLILALTFLTLGAQGRVRPERAFRDPPERRAGPRRERIVAVLHELRSRKLQKALGLPEEKANAIADRWALFDEESASRRLLMGQLRHQMNTTLMGPGSEDEKNRKLQPVVEELAVLRQQQEASRKRFEEDIRSSLTPAQQGRFILLVDEFQKSIQEAIQEQRKDK